MKRAKYLSHRKGESENEREMDTQICEKNLYVWASLRFVFNLKIIFKII